MSTYLCVHILLHNLTFLKLVSKYFFLPSKIQMRLCSSGRNSPNIIIICTYPCAVITNNNFAWVHRGFDIVLIVKDTWFFWPWKFNAEKISTQPSNHELVHKKNYEALQDSPQFLVQ
jgi:hypothetical protein